MWQDIYCVGKDLQEALVNFKKFSVNNFSVFWGFYYNNLIQNTSSYLPAI